jgi:hypothetical protein
VNGRWQLYDPTYAAFYAKNAQNEQNPEVLSFNELQQGEGKKSNVQCVVGDSKRLEEGGDLAKAFLGPDIYQAASPAGTVGLANPLIYPLSIDLKETPIILREDFGTVYQGADYLGTSCICSLHEWTLTSLRPGAHYQFELTPGHIGGEPQSTKDWFRAQAIFIEGGECLSGESVAWRMKDLEMNPWLIIFKAHHHSAKVLLSHPYRGPNVWYVTIEQLSLKPIEQDFV